MKKTTRRMTAVLLMLCMAAGFLMPMAFATETADPVAAVVAQLEAIDTLQQMQDKRSSYSVTNAHYDTNTTSQAIADEHNAARAAYEAYVAEMFAARIAAQEAYDALSAEQRAKIDSALVAKLSNDLPTVFHAETSIVTPADNEYTFEAVRCGRGYAYEVSNHMVSGNIPQTFVLVDTSNGATSWTPNGKYVYGDSNYEVAYCSDVETGLEYETDYKRINLEDSSYYGADAARHIRAILLNAYPYITMDEMKARLKSGGMNTDFVDSLTRADMIAGVQMAVWAYANAGDDGSDGLGYFASINVPKNDNIYFHAMHDYTNECWEWQPGTRQRSFDARAQYRVNTLAYYLINLPGVDAPENGIVISDVQVTRADLIPEEADTFSVGMEVFFNADISEEDDLAIYIVSYHTNEDGSVSVSGQNVRDLKGGNKEEIYVKAKSGDTINVVIEGTQHVAKGVYFYEPEGGRDTSQNLVGIGEGETRVRAEESFVFEAENFATGVRIYKTENGTGLPLEGITFSIYQVPDGNATSEIPTDEELAAYQIESNKVASITTDGTGYAAAELAQGIYLIVEEHNAEKIKAPVHPFYISIPMSVSKTSADGTAVVEQLNIVPVYPKNETVPPPEPPPIIPPVPDQVTGRFEIVKYDQNDETKLLKGAEFKVYYLETPESMVPVVIDGEELVLITDEKGYAISPELDAGTYLLVEVKAPAGYNMLEEPIAVTVVSSEMTEVTTVRIANQRGAVLPETGGAGANWFWLTGTMLIIGAALQLAARKKIHS